MTQRKIYGEEQYVKYVKTIHIGGQWILWQNLHEVNFLKLSFNMKVRVGMNSSLNS